MVQFTTIKTLCHKQILISLGIFFIEWAPTYTINAYVKICPFDNLMCLWLGRNNVNSSSSKLLRCDLIFPTSKLFPISANPFKLSKAKAIASTPQSTPLGSCYTLGRIISRTLSLQWARSQVWIGAKWIIVVYLVTYDIKLETTKLTSGTAIIWRFWIVLLKTVMRNISILCFKSIDWFSIIIIYIFIERNFRIGNDS